MWNLRGKLAAAGQKLAAAGQWCAGKAHDFKEAVKTSWNNFQAKRTLERWRVGLSRTFLGPLKGIAIFTGILQALEAVGILGISLWNWAIIAAGLLFYLAKLTIHLRPKDPQRSKTLDVFKGIGTYFSTAALLNSFAGLYPTTPLIVNRIIFAIATLLIAPFNAVWDRRFAKRELSSFNTPAQQRAFKAGKTAREVTGWIDFAGAFAFLTQATFFYQGAIPPMAAGMIAGPIVLKALLSLLLLIGHLTQSNNLRRFAHFVLDYVLLPLAESLTLGSLILLFILQIIYNALRNNPNFTAAENYGPLAPFFIVAGLTLFERIAKAWGADQTASGLPIASVLRQRGSLTAPLLAAGQPNDSTQASAAHSPPKFAPLVAAHSATAGAKASVIITELDDLAAADQRQPPPRAS